MRKYIRCKSFLMGILLILVTLVNLCCSSTNVPTATISYSELISTIHQAIESSNYYSDISDSSSVEYWQRYLNKLNIKSGLVTVNGLDTKDETIYVLAINTYDRGIVIFTIVSKTTELKDSEQKLQFVYLEQNKKIGFIPAKLSLSNSYSGYESYLNETYEYYDSYLLLNRISEILENNYKAIEQIKDTINNSMVSSLINSTPNSYQKNKEFNDLQIKADEFIDKYYKCMNQYNIDRDNANNEALKYPEKLYYIKSITYNYNPTERVYPTVTSTSTNLYDAVPLPRIIHSADEYLSYLSNLITTSDSLSLIDNLNKEDYKVERVTDSNFVISNFSIKW